MCSEKQRELYTQFETEANEIAFGQETAPDRPLTDQEFFERKRIVLKLVDRKLELELIELMKKQEEQKIALEDNTIPSNYGSHGAIQTTELQNTCQPSERPLTVWDYNASLLPSGSCVGNQWTKCVAKPEELDSNNATKRKQGQNSNNCPKKMLLMNETIARCTPYETSSNRADDGNGATVQNTVKISDVAANTIKTENTIDITTDDAIGDACTATNTILSKSSEWIKLNQLATDVFRNQSNNWALSESDFKHKNEILVQMSVNPSDIRTHSFAQILRQRVGDKKFNDLIIQSKIILNSLSRTDPANRASFCESQKIAVENLKEWNSHRESFNTQTFSGAHSNIANIISPFLCSGQNHHDLIKELIKNPHSLLSNEAVKNQIVAKGHLASNIMKNIKIVLDQYIQVRLPKKFHVPSERFIDVPFVVKLFNRNAKMTTTSATELAKVLTDSIDCMKVQKPSFRNIRFKDDTLEMLCINSMSFDWLKNTLSSHLGVNICPVKNVIQYEQLKTICLKFHVPQYLHFNNLMEQLRLDNPQLLTRRWELRSPRSKSIVDSTECVYVGVDVDSLIVMEQMNRVGTLRDSTVYFEISYEDSEENFKKMARTFVKTKKKKKQPKNKIKAEPV